MWRKWKFVLDGFSHVREFELTPGIKYRMSFYLGPKARLRILDEEGDPRLAFHNPDKEWVPVVQDFVYNDSFGECFAIQYTGKFANLEFEIIGIDFEQFKQEPLRDGHKDCFSDLA